MSMENKAVFFDRDGTLNVDIHYLHRPEDFIWIPRAKEAIRHVNDRGYLAILVTNQSGVARDYYPESDVVRVYEWMNAELQRSGAHLDALYYCPHHPQGSVARYTRACACRKPEPGMILRAAQEHGIDLARSLLVGDKISDLEAGRAAGIPSLYLVVLPGQDKDLSSFPEAQRVSASPSMPRRATTSQ